jgi:hypothetical protein
MTVAYLTELEITRALRLPDKVGRAFMAQWKIHPSFPKPIEGMNGRRFMPSVENWLRRYHGLDSGDSGPVVPRAGESFDEWRKTLKTRKPRRAGVNLPPSPVRMAPNVVATIGPSGKRLPQHDTSPMALIDGEPSPA